MGDVALVGLDTGEDKLDTNPIFAGLFNNEAYRVAQAEWLKDALDAPQIASAPYLVAFCHIPLFDPDPRANPGDIAPADSDPRYSTNYAHWQRTCANLWAPYLQEAGCQLIITAHKHAYRYDAPDSTRTWAHIVGGGPTINGQTPNKFPTVIEGEVKRGKLRITVHNIATGKVQDSFAFSPRKRK